MKKKKSKGIYLSGESVDAIKDFLRESSKIMRKAIRETHKKYPDLFEKRA